MSKPKSNSKLDALPQNQQDQLEAWLFEENISYADAVKRLKADFDVSIAPSNISQWYQRCAQSRQLKQIVESRTYATDVVKQFADTPADMYAALTNLAGKIAFDSAMDGKKFDPEMVFNFTKLVMKARKQDMEAEALNLARDKYQRDTCKLFMKWYGDKKVKEIISGDDSNDAKTEQLGQRLFGEDWK